MKRHLITLGLTMFCIASARAVMPEGPGGRLWVCLRPPTATTNMPLSIYCVDIDENWQKTNAAPNGMTTVCTGITNSYFGMGGDAYQYVKAAGMYSLWTNGTPLIRTYYDNDTQMVGSVWRLMGDVFSVNPDGTLARVLDGATKGGSSEPSTHGCSWALADLGRRFGTPASEPPVLVLGGGYATGDAVWHDANCDGDYAEPAVAVRLPLTQNSAVDAMLVGSNVWLIGSNIRQIRWNGSAYSSRDYTSRTKIPFGATGGLACGDVDGDGVVDMFTMNYDTRELMRTEDHNDDGDCMDEGESSVWLTKAQVETYEYPLDIDLYQTPGGQWVLFVANFYAAWGYGPWIRVFAVNADGTWSGDEVRIIHGDNSNSGTVPADYDASFDVAKGQRIMIEFAPNPPPPGATLMVIR